MKRLARWIPLLALSVVASAVHAAPTTLKIDRSHSEVGFNIRHFFNKVHGRFKDFGGTIVYDPDKLAASSVEVTIRDSSIDTGNDRRDNHLRGPDFFWMEKHPTIAFKSTQVKVGPDPQHFRVEGDLTIRGITKPVTLNVEFLGMGETTIVEYKRTSLEAGFTATTTINRKDWEILWNKTVDQSGVPGVMLGDDVELVLNVAAVAETPKTAASNPGKAD